MADISAITGDLRQAESGQTLARMLDEASAAFTAVSEAAVGVPEMVEQIDSAAASVEEFGFAEISLQAEGILADLRAMLGSEDAEQLPRNLSNVLESATGLLDDLRDGNAVGSLNSAMIRVGEVFKEALKLNACAVIIVHNHPSGDPAPAAATGPTATVSCDALCTTSVISSPDAPATSS